MGVRAIEVGGVGLPLTSAKRPRPQISFDDGPNPTQSAVLYPFLEQNNITATHFMIGSNIYWGRDAFNKAMALDGHIAVHTWSHPYMTTLSNEQVVAELGYTMQIIYEASGGRVAAFWRPPYGDVSLASCVLEREPPLTCPHPRSTTESAPSPRASSAYAPSSGTRTRATGRSVPATPRTRTTLSLRSTPSGSRAPSRPVSSCSSTRSSRPRSRSSSTCTR